MMIFQMFQSTHPRRVRPTHLFRLSRYITSFNPRTHVGCDWKSLTKDIFRGWFQSTHPRRVRRLSSTRNVCSLRFQSTHPRRVRHGGLAFVKPPVAFQSTHPRRVRQASTCNLDWLDMFQSTHPRRVRQAERPRGKRKDSFNPRTHVGCDDLVCKILGKRVVSIHAPT